jgi:hypothetical protein
MNSQFNTNSLDLPPALASLMSMGAAPAPAAQMNPNFGLSGAMGNTQSFIPQYAAGGMIGPAGMPQPTGVGLQEQGAPQGGMSPQMIEMQVNQFASQNPEQVQQISQAVLQLIQTGEITMEEVNMAEQLAKVAIQNPEMYPYIRNFLIQQGIATEETMSPQFDAGLLFVVLLAIRSVRNGGAQVATGGVPMGMQTNPAIPSMAQGGPIPPSKKADGGVLINAHEGEYVIPRNVVEMKGKEFFDNLVEKYKES